jgi:hypothetical protein
MMDEIKRLEQEAGNNEFWGGCPHCHICDNIVTVNHNDYGVCNEHRVFWYFGTNLFSDWRDEPPGTSQGHVSRLEHYDKVEPWYSRGDDLDLDVWGEALR